MNITSKQFGILQVILKGDGCRSDGTFIPVDLDQLLKRLTYSTTKESMQFSIRTLIKKGLIYKGEQELRRGRQRVTYFPTNLARDILGSEPSNILIEVDKLPGSEGFPTYKNELVTEGSEGLQASILASTLEGFQDIDFE